MPSSSLIVSAKTLQAVVVVIALAALAFLLVEPHLEGRNAQATWTEVYFHDPFLAYAYVASTPFFVAIYHAFRVLGFVCLGRVLAPETRNALRTIKFCAYALLAFIASGELLLLANESDDRVGGVVMGLLFALIALAIVATTMLIERMLANTGEPRSSAAVNG
ncbi:MAG: DUF2975 domain-containing protein [Pirellulales bacterium]